MAGKAGLKYLFFNGTTNSGFGDVFFLNDSVGFISSDRESIFKTTNGGITWHLIPKGDNVFDYTNISKMFFKNEEHAIMSSRAYGNTLLSTEDGFKTIKRDTVRELNGASVQFAPIDDDAFLLYGMRVFDDNYHSYIVYKSYTGQWWNKIVMDSISIGPAYCFDGGNYLLGASYLDSIDQTVFHNYRKRGLILHTIDSGKTFSRLYFDNLTSINNFYFFNDKDGFAFGQRDHLGGGSKNAAIYKTNDGGVSWAFVDSGIVKRSYDEGFLKEKYGFGCGYGNFLFTEDQGKSWGKFSIDSNINAFDASYAENIVYVTGRIGNSYPPPVVLRFKLKDEYISVDENEINSPPAPLGWIFEPYPNPAKDFVNFFIAWDSRYSFDDLNINVYNLNGDKIINPKLEFYSKTINTGTVRWFPSFISSGIYIIELEVGGFKKVQKVIVY